MGGGGGGSSGPTPQQQQLETQQAITNANLNLEENDQRKAILNAMQGTRVFRGSALSRALRGNSPGNTPQGAPSRSQTNASRAPIGGGGIASLVDLRESRASGATPSGGVGASATLSGANIGGYSGGAYNCFSGDTRVLTDDGFKRFDELSGTIRVVNHTGTHEATVLVHTGSWEPMLRMGMNLVTDKHPILVGGKWLDAALLFHERAPTQSRTVYNLHVLGGPEDAHYILENGLTAHNKAVGR